MQVEIREAATSDLSTIVELLNATLLSTTFEYTETPHTLATRSVWFARQRERGFPVLVAEVDGTVVGYAAYGDFRDSLARPGYRFTVEHSVHVFESHWGGGIGRRLMDELIGRARADGVHVMIGAIDSSNVDSLQFHTKLGFVEVARLPEVGHKFDQWLDLVLVQRIL